MIEKIQSFLDSYQIKALSKTTQDNYRYALTHLETFYKKLTGPERDRLSAGDEKMLEAFCGHLHRRKKSGATIQQYITILKMFFRFHKQPVEFTYRLSSNEKKKQQIKKIERWFDNSDIEKCLDYAFPDIQDPAIQVRNRLLVRLVAQTGARIREVASITSHDVDIENNTVFLKTSKTEPRPAFYSNDTAILFSRHLDSYRNRGLFRTEEKIFPTTDTCKKIITGMLQDLGLKRNGDGRGPHTFRHYAATKLYYDGGMDLNDLAIVLGDKPETIRDCYLHPTPAMLRHRVQKAWKWKQDSSARY